MDTIAAIATPRGNGGIAIVRISGPDSKQILARSFLPQLSSFENFVPWKLHHGKILDRHNEPLDDVLAVFMPGPATFTGEDVAEVHCHGGYVIAQAILENFLRLGARSAEAGEFTRRAFLNNRIDLTQAEAVAEMIAAPSRDSLRYSLERLDGVLRQKIESLRASVDTTRMYATIALDFPDDEVDAFSTSDTLNNVRNAIEEIDCLLTSHERSKISREGAHVVLAGPVNAGKSSLLNALCGKNRALVCELPGTTRDFIEEWINIDGMAIHLYDTAGLRKEEEADAIELLGMEKSRELLDSADAVLLVLDGEKLSRQTWKAGEIDGEISGFLAALDAKPHVIVWNKRDLAIPQNFPDWLNGHDFCSISCRTGENLDELCGMLAKILLMNSGNSEGNPLAPNTRQALLLEEAKKELESFLNDLMAGVSLDACVSHLDSATESLGMVTGATSSDELLDQIFSTFCIGK